MLSCYNFYIWNSDFKLSIRSVEKSDLGFYECQINTTPVKVG